MTDTDSIASGQLQTPIAAEPQPRRQTGASVPYVEIGAGHRLFVRDWGEGRPVVFLAGWAMDSRIWAQTMALLDGKGLRLIAYDRRGHGRSTDPGRADYDLLADDLAAVLDTLDLREAVIVAHSGAGGEAIRYLNWWGAGRVSALVLVGATGPVMLAGPGNQGGIPRDMYEATIRRLETDLEGWLDENSAPFAPTAPEGVIRWLQGMVRDTGRQVMIDFQRAIAEADLQAEAAALSIPVTIVSGDLDVSAPPGLTARRYAALIPGAELIVHQGAAHGLMLTHPGKLAADISRAASRTCRKKAA